MANSHHIVLVWLIQQSQDVCLVRWSSIPQMPEAPTITGRTGGAFVRCNLGACSGESRTRTPKTSVSCSSSLLQGVWARTEKAALRFDFHCELILMRNVENILSMVPSAQKRAQPSCCILHDVMEENIVLPNTPSKTFWLLRVYQFSLIWQDWFSTLYFVKSIVRPRQVKLISTHFPPHPRPLFSLLVIWDFSTFYALLKSLVFLSTVKSGGSAGLCWNFNVMF